jgi:hypothetical protein
MTDIERRLAEALRDAYTAFGLALSLSQDPETIRLGVEEIIKWRALVAEAERQ